MTSRTINIQEIEEKYCYHKRELERLGTVLEVLKEFACCTSSHNNVVKNASQKIIASHNKQSASTRAIELCANMLKTNLGEGYTTKMFLDIVNNEGIITKSGRSFEISTLSSVLGQSGIMKFNKESRFWELLD